uniref:Uncharacterized protein n=1 Tax=Nelumbo nucifera TaxID=4432 RepID=A0A822XYN1_NELNU|nr:TPA_asm: hypothetical protein HUJ06_025765 [Nelumbo nucifera]
MGSYIWMSLSSKGMGSNTWLLPWLRQKKKKVETKKDGSSKIRAPRVGHNRGGGEHSTSHNDDRVKTVEHEDSKIMEGKVSPAKAKPKVNKGKAKVRGTCFICDIAYFVGVLI